MQFNEIEDTLTTPVKRIEMAWKPDYDVVAVGNSNGYFCVLKIIIIFNIFILLQKHLFVRWEYIKTQACSAWS